MDFINQVKIPMIYKAIEDAYKDFSMQHKYPFVVLHIDVNSEEVDVNVHPTKMELRFSNQQEVYNAVYEAVDHALHEKELIPQVTIDVPSAKPEVPAKPQISAKPQIPARPQTPAKPQVPVRPQTPVQPQASIKPQAPVKPQVPVKEEEEGKVNLNRFIFFVQKRRKQMMEVEYIE